MTSDSVKVGWKKGRKEKYLSLDMTSDCREVGDGHGKKEIPERDHFSELVSRGRTGEEDFSGSYYIDHRFTFCRPRPSSFKF